MAEVSAIKRIKAECEHPVATKELNPLTGNTTRRCTRCGHILERFKTVVADE